MERLINGWVNLITEVQSFKDLLQIQRPMHRYLVQPAPLSEMPIRTLPQGDNFTDILRAAFCTKVFSAAFLCSQFVFLIFSQKKIGKKADPKMLVKLPQGWDEAGSGSFGRSEIDQVFNRTTLTKSYTF